jgi:hypothetical protein
MIQCYKNLGLLDLRYAVFLFRTKPCWAKSDCEFPDYPFEITRNINSFLSNNYDNNSYNNYSYNSYDNSYELDPILKNYHENLTISSTRIEKYIIISENLIVISQKSNNSVIRVGGLNLKPVTDEAKKIIKIVKHCNELKFANQIANLFKLFKQVEITKTISKLVNLSKKLEAEHIFAYLKLQNLFECIEYLITLKFIDSEAVKVFQNFRQQDRIMKMVNYFMKAKKIFHPEERNRNFNPAFPLYAPNNHNQNEKYKNFLQNQDNLYYRLAMQNKTNTMIRRLPHKDDIKFSYKDSGEAFRIPFWQSTMKSIKHGHQYNLEFQINNITGKPETIPTDSNVKAYMASIYYL